MKKQDKLLEVFVADGLIEDVKFKSYPKPLKKEKIKKELMFIGLIYLMKKQQQQRKYKHKWQQTTRRMRRTGDSSWITSLFMPFYFAKISECKCGEWYFRL